MRKFVSIETNEIRNEESSSDKLFMQLITIRIEETFLIS